MTLTGEHIGVVTLDAKEIRPIRANEIAYARQVAWVSVSTSGGRSTEPR